MTNRETVTAWLTGVLPGSALESALCAAGFIRRKGAVVYSRGDAEVRQRFKLVFDVTPRYEPTALAHLLPQVVLESVALHELVQRMVGEEPGTTGLDRPPVVVGQQLQNLAPKDQHEQATRWFIHNEADTRIVMEQVGAFAQTWAIPFLNQYQSVRSIVEGHQQGDERLRAPRPLSLYIVAAYLQVGEPTKALGVLEHVFGRPALRKQYANAFEYVRGRCAS